MKTLGKLKISNEKMLKNEELVNLKGGYGGGYPCMYICTSNANCGNYCPKCEWGPGIAEYVCVA